ncbi:HNH endonuclease [Acetobacter malorum]|uniref:HNH endonuclease 5 domain-containing protein n=1 Tax=Acetobacter malorum TaxID=178901 RepID=A0A1Y3G8H9_9PROT|nr:HNH endonuclease [Acetobacter malorum]OUJ03884.1 hypothetical protein HK23_10290 [Acetobacter malorum]
MVCVICNNILTSKNNSAEHIIPNAVGGFRKVYGFLCEPCNNKTGHEWDSVLASQLNGLCHFFDIKRERGVIPDQVITTTAGEEFKMLSHGDFALLRPTCNKKEEAGSIKYQIVARDKREAKRILHGLQQKYPNLKVDTEMEKLEVETSYLKGMVQVPCQIGGLEAGRSIVKSAVALLHASGVSVTAGEEALSYLRNPDAPACFGYYWTTDLLIKRPVGVPLHCVAISGNAETGMLLGYVEYFGFLRSVILLSEIYSGPNIENCYAIDPTTGTQLDLSVNLQFSKADMLDIFDYKHCDDEAVKRAADAVIGPGMVRKRQREHSYAVDKAVQYAFENCGAQPGAVLTDEQVRTVARLMSEKLIPFFLNLNQRRY